MPTFIKRVALKNYKSIAACDVALQSLTFLVGPNGSGKSNFLDALRFVTDGLRTSLDHALRDRGGLKDVRHRAGGQPGFGIRLEFQLPEGEEGYYAFLITAKRDGFQVQRERCWVRQRGAESRPVQFEVRSGEITGQPEPISPAAYPDRLYLVAASGLPAFRRVYDALSSFAFYSLAPAIMRDPQKREDGYPLLRDGANLASALAFMSQARPETKRRRPRRKGMAEPTQERSLLACRRPSQACRQNGPGRGSRCALFRQVCARVEQDRAPLGTLHLSRLVS